MATEGNKTETKNQVSETTEDQGSVQKIRVKMVDTASQVSEKVSGTVVDGAVKAKKLASASSAVLHTNLVKAKRKGLLVLKKTVELFTPRRDKNSDK